MITFDAVCKRFPSGHVGLNGITLHINRGEMIFLTGHSGAGKSTLLKLTTLMERPTSGQIWVGGYLLSRLRAAQIPPLRRNIGVVFQNHRLLLDRTVFDNVALPLLVAGLHPGTIGKRVRAALDMVGMLDREKLNPTVLSAGECQRVGIARAMVNRPAVLLADEPTGNLDPALSADIMNRFRILNQAGTTVLIATHNLNLVEKMGHRVITLEKGHLKSS